MDKMAILSARDIKCDYPYTFGQQTGKKRLKILDNKTNQPTLVVEFINNQYYLNSNFKNYSALKTSNDRMLVFCHVIEFNEVTEDKRLLRVLSNVFLESFVLWKLRYNIIQRLIAEFFYTEEILEKETGIPKNEIEKYILDQEIPDFYKSIAIEKGYGGALMNDICRDEYFSAEVKEILYSLAIKDKPRLTKEKFTTLKRYISKGFFLTPDLYGLTEQILEIIHPKEYIETIYWNQISTQYAQNFNDYNEGPQFPLQ